MSDDRPAPLDGRPAPDFPPETTAPPKPYHRWRANEDADFPVRSDYCLACGVKRWPRDDEQQPIAAGPCPKGMSVVPAHTNETTGQFCSGGGLETVGGRCQYGCDHADHYANDGHPECEDGPEKWVPEAIAQQEAYLESRRQSRRQPTD